MSAARFAEWASAVWAVMRAYPSLTLTLTLVLGVVALVAHFLFGGLIALAFSLVWTSVRLVYYSPLLYILLRSVWIIVRRVLRRYKKQDSVEAALYRGAGWVKDRFFGLVQRVVLASVQSAVPTQAQDGRVAV